MAFSPFRLGDVWEGTVTEVTWEGRE